MISVLEGLNDRLQYAVLENQSGMRASASLLP